MDTMTLPRFLDCSYTLLFDEYQRMGHDILTAMEKLADWAPGKTVDTPIVVKQEALVSKNDQALAELTSMLAGVRKK